MSEERKYYCICEDNCKFETMSKEQILAAITQAVENGKVHNVDTGFITKVKEMNGGRYVTFWVGTQAEYNALEERATNCMYIITDETSAQDLEAALAKLDNFNERLLTLESKAYESKEYPGCGYRMVDGKQEWLNPPMILGEVYRTTERFKGLPVYTMAFDGGAAKSGGGTIELTLSNEYSSAIEVHLILSGKPGPLIQYPFDGATIFVWRVRNASGKIYIDYQVGTDYVGEKITGRIKYLLDA